MKRLFHSSSIAVIIAATLGASSGVFFKLLGLPATTMTFFRVAVPTIILLAYLSWKKVALFRGAITLMLIASVINALRLFLYVFAYLSTSLANAVIILFTWPVFASIIGIFLLKERITARTGFLIALSFAGLVFMYINKELSFGSRDFIGMGAMLASAVLVAVMMVIFKKELSYYSKTETIFYQNLAGTLLFAPFLFINAPFPTLSQFSVATIYGLLVGLFAFVLFFFALHRLKMSHYSVLTYWEVPAAVFFGILFFDEVLTWNMVVGGMMIIVASLLICRKQAAPRPPAIPGL